MMYRDWEFASYAARHLRRRSYQGTGRRFRRRLRAFPKADSRVKMNTRGHLPADALN